MSTRKLDEVDQRIAFEISNQPGISDAELGRRLGISRSTANRRRRSNVVQSEVSDTFKISIEDIKKLSARSLETLAKLLESPNPRIALGAATQLVRLGLDLGLFTDSPQNQDRTEVIFQTQWGGAIE